MLWALCRFESLVVNFYSAFDTGAGGGTELDRHGANHGHTFSRDDSECSFSLAPGVQSTLFEYMRMPA